jgi:alkylated DNA repair protein (DNA oxidative demethylase)
MDGPTEDLFDTDAAPAQPLMLADGAALLRRFALPHAAALLADLHVVLDAAALRHMTTPGGLQMSVAMSNCGPLGWVSDRGGYRYSATDPLTGSPWPPLPPSFRDLALRAAAAAGFEGFEPDACLINRYAAGAKLSLHQDRDELDLAQPIVSVSLGLPAMFAFGGRKRSDPTMRMPLRHGDVVVWGGPARLFHHAVLPLAEGLDPRTGPYRYNLTLRRAGR